MNKKAQRFILGKLSRKAPFAWLIASAFDWTIIITTIYMCSYYNNVIFYFLSIIIIGNRQHGLALLGHDGTHWTISRNKFINDRVSDFLSFWPLGLTTTGYRNVHFQHHANLNTSKDPELIHRASKAPQWDLPISASKLIKLLTFDIFGYSLSDYIMIVRFAKPDRSWERLALVAWHIAFIAICILIGQMQVALLWYASLFTSFMMFFRIRTWTEHQGSSGTNRIKLSWLGNAIIAPHQSWHHYEHHLFPTVPYNRLKYVRKLLRDIEPTTLSSLFESYKRSSTIPSGTSLGQQ